MKREWEEDQFDIELPLEEPLFPLNVVCELLEMNYWTLHQIIDEGLVEKVRKQKRKKLLTYKDLKKLKYIRYLMIERGVNIQGIKVIFEMDDEE